MEHAASRVIQNHPTRGHANFSASFSNSSRTAQHSKQMADKDLSDSKTPHAEGAASASGQDIHNSTNTTSTNGDGGNSTAATESETENADPVETLQTLVTQHVELFERLLYVERDISNKDNIKRYQGALSEGLLRRHPADMRENMLVDWHRNAIHRALDETGTKGQIQTKEYSDGTHVKGEASAIQQMVEALSRNVFQEFLQNYNSVLSNLDQVPFVVCSIFSLHF